ncbi:MAG: 50S ribosomal protein L29 [Patescibacteria group bacterium]|nr:50S ribosomal protein L29 [Patescibacteria group bacterium]
MKVKEIREKKDKELVKMLAEKRESLREVRFKIASNQHKNVKEISLLKKDIAKVLTVMKERLLIKEA